MRKLRKQFGTTMHDILELQFGALPPTVAEGQLMIAKYARAIEIMRELPQHDQRSWTW